MSDKLDSYNAKQDQFDLLGMGMGILDDLC